VKLSKAPVTAALLTAIFIVFVLELQAGAPRNPYVLVKMGAIMSDLFARREYWRLVAAMFLHGGYIHLALNMWALWQIGGMFETLFGSTRFFLTYFISGVAASIVSSTMIPAWTPGVGASGAIFGILGALIVAVRRSPRWSRKEWSKGLSRQLSMVAGFNLTLGLTWAASNILLGLSATGIDNGAHIGGLVAGLLLGLVPHRVPPPPPNELTIDVQALNQDQDRS